MPTPQIQNDPIYNLPFLYKYGLTISNDATTPNTVLDIAAGYCRDSNDVIDIELGTSNPNIEGGTTAAPLLLNAAVNGVNGLDTGALAAATMYAIYMIADSRYYMPTACIATLASNSTPLIPFGYDSYRLIGYWATQTGSAFWSVGYYTGLGSDMKFTYGTVVPTAVTAGNATVFTAVNLTAFVPPVNNSSVSIYSVFTPGAASRVFQMKGFNQTAFATTVTGQVAAVVVTTTSSVLAQLNGALPEILYLVSNAGDAVAIDVAGFSVSV